MCFDARVPDSAAKPGRMNDLSLSRGRIFLADPKTLEHRMADLQVDCLDGYWLRVGRVSRIAGDGVDRLIRGAITLDDPLQGGRPKLDQFSRGTLGRFEGSKRGVTTVRCSRGQIHQTFAGKKAQRHRLRCRPSDRPIAGRESQAHFVAWGKCVSDIVHRHRYQVPLTRLERFRMLMTIAVRKV